nr:hypothetical protein [Tanacetum cinerariifolium]
MMVDQDGGDGVDMYRRGKEGGENDFLGRRWMMVDQDGGDGVDMYRRGKEGGENDFLDHVNACTAYMLYYLTIKRPFNLITMILYRMEENQRKRVAPPSSSSSSSSSDENEEPSFLEFYEELSNNKNLTNAQKEKRRMFKC